VKTDCPAEILDLGFSKEPLSPLPVEESRIWRYMDLAKFVAMLQHGALYFPVMAKLGDDLEAAPPRLPTDADEIERQRLFSFWSVCRCTLFASCWHLAEDESAAMWAIYAGRHQGIVIQSKISTLLTAFPAAEQEDMNKMLKIGRVEYIDPDLENRAEKFPNLYAAVLRKRHWYRYEDEIRIICSQSENWVPNTSTQEGERFCRSGVWVRCDLRKLIQRVVVAPKAPSYLKPAVSEIFKRFGFDPASVHDSRLNETVRAPDPEKVHAEVLALIRNSSPNDPR